MLSSVLNSFHALARVIPTTTYQVHIHLPHFIGEETKPGEIKEIIHDHSKIKWQDQDSNLVYVPCPHSLQPIVVAPLGRATGVSGGGSMSYKSQNLVGKGEHGMPRSP